MNEKPKQEYGYLLIDTAGKKETFSSKLKTDQVLVNGEWLPVGEPLRFATNDVYRREIDPGEGFEIVPPNDKLSWENLESTEDGLTWCTSHWGDKVTALEAFQCCHYEHNNMAKILAFRRRKQPATVKEDLKVGEWIDVRKALPKTNGYYIGLDRGEAGLFHYHQNTGWQNSFKNDDITHWMPLPPPPKDPAEVAFEEWLAEYRKTYFVSVSIARDAWNAGREFERKERQ